jgi:hypothetical protein
MLVCYFSKSIIGVWYKLRSNSKVVLIISWSMVYTLRSYSKVVLIISWDTLLSSNWEVGNQKDITLKNCCQVKFEIFMIVFSLSLSLVGSSKTIYCTFHDSRKVARSTCWGENLHGTRILPLFVMLLSLHNYH